VAWRIGSWASKREAIHVKLADGTAQQGFKAVQSEERVRDRRTTADLEWSRPEKRLSPLVTPSPGAGSRQFACNEKKGGDTEMRRNSRLTATRQATSNGCQRHANPAHPSYNAWQPQKDGSWGYDGCKLSAVWRFIEFNKEFLHGPILRLTLALFR